MNYVEPIRDRQVVLQILAYLKQKNHRDYLMFLIGFNTGLRISDILNLTYDDLSHKTMYLREKKTKKLREIPINYTIRQEIKQLNPRSKKEYIFKSRQGHSYITRQRAYQIIKEIEQEFGLKNLGCHTLRKTFGYHFYQEQKDVVTLQEILNHSRPEITLRYIGVNRNMVNEAYKAFHLG